MSREGAPAKQPKAPPAAGTPIWVWVIYALGIFAAGVFVFSVLFTAGARLLSDDESYEVGYDVSAPAIALWGALTIAAVVTWIARRRGRR